MPSATPVRRTLGMVLALLAVTGIAIADYWTGPDIGYSLFYLLPVMSCAWLLGAHAAVATALAASVGWFAADVLLRSGDYVWVSLWNGLTRCVIYVCMGLLAARVKASRDELERRGERLVAAYEELEARRREQLDLKDQVLSHVSHELRTPLTAIYQFVTLLLDGVGGELTGPQREYLQVALRNVRQLRAMIGDLLETTRAETGKLSLEPRPVDLAEAVLDLVRTVRSVAAEKGISLETEAAPGMPLVRADPTRLRQVLTNLVDNALKFTPPGGRIRVSSAPAPDRPGFVTVHVADTGRGMSPEVVDRIFDRLYQADGVTDTTRRGLGLGLYLSRQIVMLHGGQIWARSEPGEGSTVSFTLPIVDLHGVSDDQT